MNLRRYPRPAIVDACLDARDLVIEASAGTGKTWTMERIVAALVIDKEIPIEEILVVTFTRKAAAELKMRIRRLFEDMLADPESESAAADLTPDAPLEEAAWELDDSRREVLASALRNFDAATVTTIHAFARSVLQDCAFDGGLPFVNEPTSSEHILEEAWRQIVRERLALDPELVSWFRILRTNEPTVRKLQSTVTSLVRSRVPFAQEFRPEAYRRALRDLLLALAPFPDFEAAKALTEKHWQQAKSGIKPFATRIEKIRSLALEIDPDDDPIETLLTHFPRKVLDDPRAWIDQKDESLEALGPEIQAFVHACESLVELWVPPEFPLIQLLVPLVNERFVDLKRQQGVVDQDDLLLLLSEGVAREPQVVATIRERYSHALIDEFQDTDPLQWSIFDRVFRDASAPDHRLIVVGDPKQAIYRFRGADLGTYLGAVAQMEAGDAHTIALDRNYRSTAGLVETVNLIAQEGAGAAFFSGRNRYPDPVDAAHHETRRILSATGDPRPPLGLLSFFEEEEAASADENRKALWTFIAAELQRCVAEDVLETETGTRPLRYRDVDLLVRTRNESEGLLQVLREAGVPAAVFGSGDLYASEEALDLRDLLEAIEDPTDPDRRLRAWLGPYFDLSLDALASGRDLPREDPLLARLRAWHELALGRHWEELSVAIFEDSGLGRRWRVSDEGERSLRISRQLLADLIVKARHGGDDLASMIARLRRRESGSDDDIDEGEGEELFDVDRDFVRIMTMHKSKGLEAPIVFLAGGFGRSPVNTSSLRVLDLPEGRRVVIGKKAELPEAWTDAAKIAEHEENERLAYVAMTRARSRLYAPYIPSSLLKSQGQGALAPFFARVSALIEDGDLQFDSLMEFVPRPPLASPPPSPEAIPEGSWTPRVALCEEASSAPWPSRLVTSYSALKKGLAAAEGERWADEESSPKIDGDPVLPPGREAGLFLHELLEEIDGSSLVTRPPFEEWRLDPELIQLADRAAKRWGFSELGRDRGLEICHRTLTLDLPLGDETLRPLAAMQSARPELEFLLPLPSPELPALGEEWTQSFRIERGFLTGAIDLVFRHKERYYLLDWKSDLLADDRPETIDQRVRDEYLLQARVYALALARVINLSDADDHARRFGGVAYVFLRHRDDEDPHRGLWFQRPSWEELEASERELDALTRRGGQG
jgi:exodeoxyribonuclease V beta subunit